MRSFILLLILIVLPYSEFLPQDTPQRISLGYRTKELPFGLTTQIPDVYPKIGFALSGGGARGLAQIGVLRVFEQNGIIPDIITGTSIGSVVGGLYSSGYSIEELDSIALETDWNSIISPAPKSNRNTLFIDQKITEDRAVLTLRLDGLTPVIPNSVNSGQKLLNFLNILAVQSPVGLVEDFSRLQTDFTAVCTNLENGTPYLFRSGLLGKALRASSSVTFLLSPVEHNDTTLVDGGLVANIPVEITKERGADLVIAVNSTSPLHEKENLKFPWILADQILSIPMRLLNEQQLALADYVITPEIGNKNSNDFTDISELLFRGLEAAVHVIDTVKLDIQRTVFRRLYEGSVPVDKPLASSASVEFQALDSLVSEYNLYNRKLTTGDLKKLLYDISKSGSYTDLGAELRDSSGYTIITLTGREIPYVNGIMLDDTGVAGEKVMEIFGPLERKHFNPRTLITKLKTLIRFYRSEGYSLARIKGISFDEKTGLLSISVNTGIINGVRIKNTSNVEPLAVFRELNFKEGDIFNVTDISRSLQNLESTNLFDEILVDVEIINDSNYVVLNLQDKITSLVRIGFKINNENTPQVSIDIRDENLFSTTTELGSIFFLSPRKNQITFEHKANRIFDSYFTYKLNAFWGEKDYYTYAENNSKDASEYKVTRTGEYRESVYGVSLALGTQVGRFGNLVGKAKLEKNKITDLENSSALTLDANIFTFSVSTTIDTKDRYPYTNKGIRFFANYETAQSLLGGETGFTNFYSEYEGYLSFTPENTAIFTAKLGFADKTLPLSQMYSLGGQYSFFGMRDDELRGRQILKLGLEYRYKLPFRIFFDTYVSARYDVGSIWEQEEKIKIKDLRHGIGITVSFDTPLGPADISYGRSFFFNRDISQKPVKWGPGSIYFSLGFYY